MKKVLKRLKLKNKMENNFEHWSENQIKRRKFFSFAAFGVLGSAGILGYKWYRSLPETANGLSALTRKVLSFNEKINAAFFKEHHLVKTFPRAAAAPEPRVNGDIGVDTEIDENEWLLQVMNPTTNKAFNITIDQIKALPKTEITFDFKCIEGWTEVVNYGGAKLSDFMAKFNFGLKNETEFYKYLGMETPDGNYYVGLDMKSALHPQTILCYEMNGAALPADHGAPLRLIIPVKYGVKNLKRIGKIFVSDNRPADYWHEAGYDYDAAL
jgi:Oxidoreductase molybdopterin binding domain